MHKPPLNSREGHNVFGGNYNGTVNIPLKLKLALDLFLSKQHLTCLLA